MTAALAISTLRFTIRIQSGPDKGGTLQLLPPRVSIGRDPENDISISDPRCRRQHAVIEFKPTGIIVRDISGRATMTVNGAPTEQKELQNGDIIGLGDTELVFVVDRPQQQPQAHEATAVIASGRPGGLPPAGPPRGLNAPPGEFRMGPSADQRTRPKSAQGGNRTRFYMIVGVVGLLVALVLSTEEPQQQAQSGIRSDTDVEKDISDTETRLEELRKRRTFASAEEETRYREAQAHYLQGFRDYQKGNYGRAMRSFETAKAIDHKHELAGRYYDQARRRRDEMIDIHILEGRRYKEKMMYNRCAGSLAKVIDLLRHSPQEPRFKEASALKAECDLLDGERF